MAVGWVAWAVLTACAWLVPSFGIPWVSFDRELVAAIAGIALMGGLLVRGKAAWQLPTPALVAFVLIASVAVQWRAGIILFDGDAWMSALYLLAFGLAVVTGARAREGHGNFAIDAFWLAVGMASFLSVGLQLKQWLQIDGLVDWTMDVPKGARPFANLGQPNLLATLHCWSLLAIWWAYRHGRLRGWIATPAAAFVLCGIAMTQSRTAWLVLALLVIGACVYRRALDSRRSVLSFGALIVFFVLLVAGWDALNEKLYLTAALDLHERIANPGTRWKIWSTALAAIADRPLFGWGWSQVGVAQQALALRLPHQPELIDHSHDIILDMLVWTGVPIGLTVAALSLVWLWRRLRAVGGADDALLVLGVVSFATHAMLEYPHTYLFMLVPMGWLVGLVRTPRDAAAGLHLPRAVVATLFVAAAASTAATALEYIEARANTAVLRFEMARVGANRHSTAPDLHLLTQLRAVLTVDRLPLDTALNDEQMALVRRTAQRFPAERLLVHEAVFAVHRGELDDARASLRRLCTLHTTASCAQARAVWDFWGRERYPWLAQLPFPAVDSH